MSYTKPVIREPYYDCPTWFDQDVDRIEFLVLSTNCNSSEVELFLVHLFGYNSINIDQSMDDTFNELLVKDSVAILGGIAFFESENKLIMPSCCCGLEQFRDIYNSVTKKESPWLGHDPFPVITYIGDLARVWSDDPESIESYYIDFKYKELLDNLEESKRDLECFIDKPLYQWIYRKDQRIAQIMKEKMYEWFLVGIDS
ncbi:hypothetical protein [Paenibacillus durus]|uniref:Uncharacterized protein n=1 Tax=Paenibacillus durus ATCC 35681 TaxID=1333534 RepID=A0A0F7FCP5_PAEDU|nr:hypothetical protein [Paenibacillus durus]AKG36178.1 hypothetical protein VK70_17750 [Paenibacillus durus ATCC 35681]